MAEKRKKRFLTYNITVVCYTDNVENRVKQMLDLVMEALGKFLKMKGYSKTNILVSVERVEPTE